MSAIEQALRYLEASLNCLKWPDKKVKEQAWAVLHEAYLSLEKLSGR